MSSEWERLYGFDANDVSDGALDSDSDDLTNAEDFLNNTLPFDNDTDNDWLGDGYEVNVMGTNPLSGDTDGDQLPDFFEGFMGLDPLDPADALLDADNDQLSNVDEFLNGTNMNDPDSDADWLPDGLEINVFGTNPLTNDTDGDQIDDYWEAFFDVGPTDPASASQNPDGDAFTNLQEFNQGTNPLVPDP